MNELRQTKEYYVHKEKILEQRKLDQEEYDEAVKDFLEGFKTIRSTSVKTCIL